MTRSPDDDENEIKRRNRKY